MVLFLILKVFSLLAILPIYLLVGIWRSIPALVSRIVDRQAKSSGKTVAITGGRSPYTLELTRMLRKSGHRVVMIESLPFHLSKYSSSIAVNYTVPSPIYSPVVYFSTVGDILQRENADLLIPTCEEVFHLAKAKAEIQKSAPKCKLFFEDITTLKCLHSKWEFAELVRKKRDQLTGLNIPPTRLIVNEAELRDVIESDVDIVLKPCFSRFAQATVILPRKNGDKRLEKVRKSLRNGIQWVAQKYIEGRQLCTYSVAQDGKLLAHCCYATEFTPGGQGATMVWESIIHPVTEAAISSLMRLQRLSGQYAFDFIEQNNGSVYVIECNPRSTSGIHLFANQLEFCESFFSKDVSFQTPLRPLPNQFPSFVAAALVFFNFFSQTGPSDLKKLSRWLYVFVTARDIIWDINDLIPTFTQYLSAAQLALKGLSHGVNAIEATTLDIEWNGE